MSSILELLKTPAAETPDTEAPAGMIEAEAPPVAAPLAPLDEAAPQPQPQPAAASLVDRLESDARAAAEAFAASKETYAAALVDAAEGRLEAPQLAGYRNAYEVARERALEADMALNVARDRETARRLAEARAQSAAAWERAGVVADARVDAMARLDEAAATFAKAWRDAIHANESLYGATPAHVDLDGAQMRVGALENLIRIELARRGVVWAHDFSPSLLITRPAFMEIMRETPAVIRGWATQFAGV